MINRKLKCPCCGKSVLVHNGGQKLSRARQRPKLFFEKRARVVFSGVSKKQRAVSMNRLPVKIERKPTVMIAPSVV